MHSDCDEYGLKDGLTRSDRISIEKVSKTLGARCGCMAAKCNVYVLRRVGYWCIVFVDNIYLRLQES